MTAAPSTDQDFPMFAMLRAAIAAAIIAVSAPALAHDYKTGDLVITHPWTRATAPGARVAAGYMVIENRGAQADRLVSATFSGSATVELHEMAMEGNVMKMRELPRGIAIPAGGKVELKPGGLHLMFMALKGGLGESEMVKGVLVFERAGRIDVDFKVEAMGARGGHEHHGHGAHGAGHGHGHHTRAPAR
jgi:periplasmic copper chaperone A